MFDRYNGALAPEKRRNALQSSICDRVLTYTLQWIDCRAGKTMERVNYAKGNWLERIWVGRRLMLRLFMPCTVHGVLISLPGIARLHTRTSIREEFALYWPLRHAV